MERKNKYSMKDLVTEICRENVYMGKDKDNSDLHAGNRISKTIRPKILPTLRLDTFIKEYEGNEQKPYNYEWKEFFYELLKAYEFDGTTKTDNPGREKIVSGPLAQKEMMSIRNAEIFGKLLRAVKTGKNPDVFLEKLKKTDFYSMCVAEMVEIAILRNFTDLFDSLREHYNELSGEGIVKRLYYIQDTFEPLTKELQLPFSVVVTKAKGVLD